MKQFLSAAITLFALLCVPIQAMSAECANPLDKDGKPLAGAAKQAALKKCRAESAPVAKASAAGGQAACEEKAVSKKTGKKLHGAAKSKFMEKCLREG